MFSRVEISVATKNSFIVYALFVVVGFILQLLYSKMLPEYIPEIKSEPYIHGSDQIKIYMFLLNGNPQNLQRCRVGYEYWARDFAEIYNNSILRVGTALDLDVELDYQYIFPWNNSLIHFQNFLHIFIQSLYDFYYSTDLDWYVRTTDDCLVDIRKLPLFMNEIGDRKNPKRDVIIKGHLVQSPVIVKNRNFAYLHGGSGWIMSREAVRQFLLHEQDYIDEYYSEYAKGDDIVTFFMMNRMKLHPQQINSFRFLGIPLVDSSVEILEYNWYEEVKICNTTIQLNPNMYLKDVVFWHAGRADMVTTVKGFKYLSDIPIELKVEFVKERGYLCFFSTNPYAKKR